MKKILSGLIIASSLLFAQSEVKININDKTLEVSADVFMNYYYRLDNTSKYYFGANYIKNENDNGNKSSLLGINFKILSEVSYNKDLLLGIGVKAVLVDNGIDENFVSIPFGIHAVYKFTNDFSIDGNGYYGPRVLSFSDAKRYVSYELNVNYQIVNNGLVYLGARNIETQYENIDSMKFDKSLYAGFKFLF